MGEAVRVSNDVEYLQRWLCDGGRMLPTSMHDRANWSRLIGARYVGLNESNLAVVADFACTLGHPDAEALADRSTYYRLSRAEQEGRPRHPAWQPPPIWSTWVLADDAAAELCAAIYGMVGPLRHPIDIIAMVERCARNGTLTNGMDAVSVAKRLRAGVLEGKDHLVQVELEERMRQVSLTEKLMMDDHGLARLNDIGREVVRAHGLQYEPRVRWDVEQRVAAVDLFDDPPYRPWTPDA